MSKDESNNNQQDEKGESNSTYNRKSQLNLRVNKEKKERWKDFVGDSKYQNVSHFLRHSAESQIAREQQDDSQTKSQVGTESLDKVIERLDEISTKLKSIDRRLSGLEAERYDDEEIKELAPEVFQQLPSSVNEIQQEQADKVDGKDANTGSIEDLARTLGVEESAVEMAIQRLRNTTYSIKTTENEKGTTFYYKRE